MKVTDFMEEFVEALTKQLEKDEERWGDTWLKRTIKGQEERTRKSFNDKWDQFENAGTPVPWLKMAGDVLICWIREQYPELWPDG